LRLPATGCERQLQDSVHRTKHTSATGNYWSRLSNSWPPTAVCLTKANSLPRPTSARNSAAFAAPSALWSGQPGRIKWDGIRDERSQDLLVYLAMSKFGKRVPVSKLPNDIRLDVRAFFSTYNQACAAADELLFSAGDRSKLDRAFSSAPVGKLTPSALYVHESALSKLPPVLRVYEACGRVLIGTVEGANVIKLHRDELRISYLKYPDFETDPHPALAASMLVHLQTFRVKYREYTGSDNPPILHRKEEFVAEDHPLRDGFAELTRQEEAAGLYESPSTIGTRSGWERVLKENRVLIEGRAVRQVEHG
jgi:DNA phosphorothioation-associated putative methyltransferase